jgi:hypothetical protein
MKNFYFLMFFSLFLQGKLLAQDYSDPLREGEVVVEKSSDLVGTYKDRRNRYGLLFSINYEKFSPDNYLSLIQDKYFDEVSDGSAIPVVGGELGVKFNFSIGSLSGLVGYAGGSFKSESHKIENINVKISKASLNLALDGLTSEPWVVPYGQIGVAQLGWSEESYDVANALKQESFITDWNLTYKLGLLFQLNWIESAIDPNTHRNGLMSSGLQNTFLDVFYSSYAEPTKIARAANESGEADLSSENFGVGLKLEF